MNTYKDTLRLVKGNDFATIHDIVAKYPDDTVVEGFDLNLCTDLTVRIKRGSISSFNDIATYAESWLILEPKKIRINFDGLKMKNGSYRIEFLGKFQGKDWRCYSNEKGFGIVESNEEANIPADTIIADGVYQILTDFTMTYQTQEQANWDETDTLLPSYIKNKPDLNDYVEKVEGYGLSENDYSDEEKQKVADAVPNTREINGKALDSDIVLTSSDIGALPTSTKYGYSIDLSLNSRDFKLTATLKDQDGNSLNSKMVDLPLETMVVSGRYDSSNKVIVLTLENGNPIDIPVGDLVRGLQSEITSSNKLSSDLVDDTNSTNKFVSASEKTSWDSKQDALVSGTNIKTINNQSLLGSGNIDIEGGGSSGEENVIEIVKVNNVALTPDENKAVNVSVPTQLSELIEDTTHRTVADSEKAYWDGKSDFSGSYDDLTDKPTIPEEITVDSALSSTSTNPVQNKVINSALGGKVDVVSGKGLSTEDYTTTEKNKLAGLENYDDSALRSLIATKADATALASLVDGGNYNSTSKKIELKHGNTVLAEIDATAFIKDGMVSSVTIDNGYLVITFNTDAGQSPIRLDITSIFNAANYYTKTQTDNLLSGKQDTINDLSAIRSGAALGATAVQTESDPTVPSWAKASSKPSYTASEVGAVPTTRKVNGKALSVDITLSASDVDALPSSTVIPDAQIQSDWNQSDNTKKDYIKNKPTIPAAQVNSDWDASSGVAQILNKPTIPTALSQLTEDTTHRVVTDTEKSTWNSKTSNIGTITGINMNGASKGTSGVVDLGTVITAHQDISGKADKNEMSVSTSGDQTTITLKNGTSATVINSHQSLSGKQDTLVSGTNIKTINGNSLLGSGNLSTLTPIVNHGTSDTTFAVTPNVLHIWGTVASLTLTLATPTDNTIVNEYMIEFTSGSTATTLSLPSSVEWAESCGALSVEASKTYQISIVNNIGIWCSIANS